MAGAICSRRDAGVQFGAARGGSAAEPRLGGFCQLVRQLAGSWTGLPRIPPVYNAAEHALQRTSRDSESRAAMGGKSQALILLRSSCDKVHNASRPEDHKRGLVPLLVCHNASTSMTRSSTSTA